MKHVTILLVEDNEDDIVIIKRVFKKVKITNAIKIVRGGREALDYIYHRGAHADVKYDLPDIILLDISMPGMNGFEVLYELKADPIIKRIPIVMLTSSSREEDIVKSYENGACSYITKPMNFDDFVKAIERFEIYWSLVSKVP